MKKIFCIILSLIMFLVSGCKNNNSNNELDTTLNYINSLNSYNLTAEMTVYRHSKEMKIGIEVDYLKPDYYKVKFKNKNGEDQYIVKNDEGVFVLTPALNKEFKFDSQWPLNSSHAYLLEGIKNDILIDQNHEYKLEGICVVVECKLSMPNSASKLQFYYDLINNKPVKAICKNDNNEVLTMVEFKSFSPNKKLSKNDFNSKYIMEESVSEGGNLEDELNLTVSCGNVLSDMNLVSSRYNGDLTILCYSGENKNYTITVNKVEVYSSSVILEEYNEIEYLECGLVLSNDSVIKYYDRGYEISIYYKNMSLDELLLIADSIELS